MRLGQGARFFGIRPNGDGKFSRGDRFDAADIELFIREFRFHVLLQLLPCFAQRSIVTADEGKNLSGGVLSAQEAQVPAYRALDSRQSTMGSLEPPT